MSVEQQAEIPFDENDPFSEPVYSSGGLVYVRKYTDLDMYEAFAMVQRERSRLRKAGIVLSTTYKNHQEMHDRYVENDDPDDVYLGIWNKVHSYVGHMRLGVKRNVGNPRGVVSFYLGKEHEGKGYMTAALATVTDVAFQKLGLASVEGSVFEDNKPSAGVFRRLNFTEQKGYVLLFSKQNTPT